MKKNMVSLSFSAIYMLIEEPGIHKPLALIFSVVGVFLKWYKICSTYFAVREFFVPDTDTKYKHFIHP